MIIPTDFPIRYRSTRMLSRLSCERHGFKSKADVASREVGMASDRKQVNQCARLGVGSSSVYLSKEI